MGNTEAAALVRGTFHDDLRDYTVRTSTAHAPDSFQVVTGEHEDIVLVVSGLNSGNYKTTWGPFWRSFKPTWKIWVEEAAMRVFNRGRTRIENAPATVRWCNG
ncbi:hypothetical protein AB0K52_24165 [Glycomyces sp. NPDC049804]|uniref:hypothetical protein n=1 Tax=Glycomyces sp. NPDC049804 TaxID=3154363 RepID=UPI00341C8207